VVPDVAGIDKRFDYLAPADTPVGAVVRTTLHGRRVGAWIVDVDVIPPPGVILRPVNKVSSLGPPADVVAVAEWASWRWAGRITSFLRSASPPTAVHSLPPAPKRHPIAALTTLPSAPRTVLRAPPASDGFDFVTAAAARGDALVLAPSVDAAALVAARLRRTGVPVALVPRDWARAAAGGCVVVGARAAAWAPVPDLAAVVVLDAHDEVYQEERTPTWNAWQVAAERARRARVPCVLVTPCPTLEQVAWGSVASLPRATERAGWAVLEIVDRRKEDPRSGLFSERLVDALRSGGRVACVLNRKGRAKLLACNACGEVARCERCDASVELVEGDRLQCRRCGTDRPVVCQSCGAQRLKLLRPGVSRVREELEALAGVPVGEVTGESADLPDTSVLVGTEALLHRLDRADVVAFLDFDQELLAPRYRAAEQALALLARASRLVGGRGAPGGGGRVLVQTRLPQHEVLDAALYGDPSRLAAVERARREALGMPPFGALALVSGDGADAFVAGLGQGVDVLGPDDGRYLLRAPSHDALCDTLAAAPRPSARLRIEVDPLRA
jgi:primosomal protein N' (replication factor Y)